MPQQTINIGSAPDDGTGDTLRVGGDKINDNFTELYTDKADKAGGTFTGDVIVPDEAYDATAWNGSLEVPTKNAVRDKIESLGSGITELDDIPDVNAPSPANGDVLTWDSTPGEWVAAAPTGGSNALDDLTDVDAPTPSDGDVLTFDSGSGDWVPAAPAGASADYAHVKKSADQTGANYTTGTIVSFNTEVEDTNNIHGLNATVTITIASPGVVTWTGHNFLAGSPIVLTTSGALPTGLTAGTTYYVVSPAANTFQLASTPGGSAINTTGSQSGTHTATNYSRLTGPAGKTRASLSCQLGFNNVTADVVIIIEILKNGLTSWDGYAQVRSSVPNTVPHTQIFALDVPYSSGDQWEIKLTNTTDTSIDLLSASCWFKGKFE